MTGRTHDSPPAFSLVELLVTAGVVLLLVGILLPSLSRAREQARSTLCQSNIRQLAMANGLYAQESGGVYVPGASEFIDRKSTRLNSSHIQKSRMPSSA